MHECVCAHVCCDMPRSATPNSHIHLPLLHVPPPVNYCPTPDPTLPIPAGPVAKKKTKKKNSPKQGNHFAPLWGGYSLWICQPNLGPSSLGSCAQQAPSAPPVHGGLWNEPPDSRLWRCAFVQQLQGGIDDWLHLCVCETLDLQR